MRALLHRLERNPAEIRGLTETRDGSPRLQANFMLVAGDAMTSGALPRVLSAGLALHTPGRPLEVPIGEEDDGSRRTAAVVPYDQIADAWAKSIPERLAWARALPKRIGELGLAAHLPRTIARRYADYLESWLLDRSDRLAEGEHFDPLHIFWEDLIDAGVPLLNKELLLVNPLRVPTIIRLGEVCARHGNEASRAALRDLVPSYPGFPRSYLRLSEALVDAGVNVMA